MLCWVILCTFEYTVMKEVLNSQEATQVWRYWCLLCYASYISFKTFSLYTWSILNISEYQSKKYLLQLNSLSCLCLQNNINHILFSIHLQTRLVLLSFSTHISFLQHNIFPNQQFPSCSQPFSAGFPLISSLKPYLEHIICFQGCTKVLYIKISTKTITWTNLSTLCH